MNNTTSIKEAQNLMIKGIKTATQAIRPTYGHNGINAVIEHVGYPYHQVANDAQTIIQSIRVSNPIENQGLSFLKELSDKQNSMSGDGRKTTCIIAETILEEGFKSKVKGIKLKDALNDLITDIEFEIAFETKFITENDVYKVATIAGESSEIGNLIGDIYKKIGKDGLITVESSGTYDDDIKYIDGVRFEHTGFLTPSMVHDEEAKKEGVTEKRAVYENPTILVTKQKIEKISDIDPLLQSLMENNKKDLVIFTDNIDDSMITMLIETHKNGIFNILVIKAPTIFKREVFEDFAKVTGSTIVEQANGIFLSELPISCLGTCDKIIVDKDDTIIMGTKDISEHIAQLQSNNDELSNLRLKWLKTKTAILKLGANNESELSYKRLKCEDAVNASRLALNGGVVLGGGVTLYNIAKSLPNTVAGKILRKALKAPLLQIYKNSGKKIYPWTTPTISDDVLDASLVLKNAIRNAISLSSIVLTTGIVVHLIKENSEIKL
jgi:chaperonin GroEL